MYNAHKTSGETEPSWERALQSAGDALPARADVCVIGAGMAGLSTAYELLRSGRSVVVLERGELGAGETARTTAHLASAVDEHFYLLERMHGRVGAKLVYESHAAAITKIENIAREEQIECDFSRLDGYLFAAHPKHARELEREFEAAIRVGIPVAQAPQTPLPFDTGFCLRFADQAQIEPMRYLNGLARAIRSRGGAICTNAHVQHVEEGQPCKVQLADGVELLANEVVVATNSPINDVFAMHTKQAPYRSYVIALEIAPGSVEQALYWDTGDPYHYVRLQGQDLLIVGGEDHKAGQARKPEESWDRLEAWTRERFPFARQLRHRWSGQVQEPADGLAFIGRNPGHQKHVYIVTGDSGNGMTHGALGGVLLADLICGRDNPWASLYDPRRKVSSLHAARDFLKENLNVAMRYGDWLLPRGASTEQIARGTGAVIRRGVKPIAVFVDEGGARHECSAICPHLGGIVAWNRAERSWDCPCHGSRFSPYGEVMTGPAASNLAPVSTAPAKDEHKPSAQQSSSEAAPLDAE